MNSGKLGAAVVAACIAVLALGTATAAAGPVRTLPLHDGLNKANFNVKDNSDGLPPAIVLSTRPANLNCKVGSYHYGAIQKKGRLNIRLRCQDTPRNARARLTFRAPYKRNFQLRNGTHTIRIAIDKPRGNVRPLGSLNTRPRKTNCDVTPTGSSVGADQFNATARMTCHGVPAESRGILGIGGLVAPDFRSGPVTDTPTTSKASRASASSVASVSISKAQPAQSPKTEVKAPLATASADTCDGEKRVTVARLPTLVWKDCYSGPFRLEPWESQFIGISFKGPQFSCTDDFKRSLDWLKAPPSYFLVKNTDVRMDTDPDDAYWYSWSNITGLVTNWQFSGSITFRFVYRCFKQIN